MKKFLKILIFVIFFNIKIYSDLPKKGGLIEDLIKIFLNQENQENSKDKNKDKQNQTFYQNKPNNIPVNDINIDEKTTLIQIRDLLCQILAEIKKGHFNIFNVNLQNGNAITASINNLNNNHNSQSHIEMTFTEHITEETKNHLFNFVNWIKNNKKRATLTAIISSYCIINSKLLYLTKKLSYENNWSNWKKDKSMEDLYKMTQNKLAKTLLKDIQKYYMKLSNITDNVTPLVSFIKDIDKEIKYLRSYQNIIRNLEKLKINKGFFYSKKLLICVPEKINRALFLKNTFLAWLSEHKINQYKKLKRKIPK